MHDKKEMAVGYNGAISPVWFWIYEQCWLYRWVNAGTDREVHARPSESPGL